MKVIIIFGPCAVGKMSVGIELSKITGYKLFHNHMIIEPLNSIFGFQYNDMWKLVSEFRNRIFEEVSISGISGIIFTYVWALDQESDHNEILNYLKSLKANINEVLFVELEADQSERLIRNKSEQRLNEKKSKRDTVQSEAFLIDSEIKYKLNSNNDFFYPDNHIKINNTYLNPDIVANIIKQRIDLNTKLA